MLSNFQICISVYLTETLLKDHEFKINSNYHFPNYKRIHYERKTKKIGGGVFLYIRNDPTNKILNDLCVSDGKRETMRKSMKKNIVSCCYKSHYSNWKNHCDHLEESLTNYIMENKLYFVTGNFNLNCLEFHQCSEIRQFSNNMLEKGANPLINRPTRVTTSSARPIDIFKKGIIKTSISDHFTIFAAIKLSNEKTKN